MTPTTFIMNMLIRIMCFTSLITIAAASSFSQGVAIGYISSDLRSRMESPSTSQKIPNYFTRDTSFNTLHGKYHPQCINEIHLMVDPPLPPPTLFEIIFILSIVCVPPCICCVGSDDDKDLLMGVFIGSCIHSIISDDNH